VLARFFEMVFERLPQLVVRGRLAIFGSAATSWLSALKRSEISRSNRSCTVCNCITTPPCQSHASGARTSHEERDDPDQGGDDRKDEEPLDDEAEPDQQGDDESGE
jgi:hypothetical protein